MENMRGPDSGSSIEIRSSCGVDGSSHDDREAGEKVLGYYDTVGHMVNEAYIIVP